MRSNRGMAAGRKVSIFNGTTLVGWAALLTRTLGRDFPMGTVACRSSAFSEIQTQRMGRA